jgi:uncharacterized protein GlcG (DUF336 family)
MITVNNHASISAETAEKLIAGAVEEAEQLGKPMCIAVVDPAGTLVAFKRMDGAPLLAVDISQNKAYTAVSFGISTDTWFDFISEDPPLRLGIVHTPRLVVFGGGYPVKSSDGLIGAIGVSGGHYSDDMQVAQAGLRGIGLDPAA